MAIEGQRRTDEQLLQTVVEGLGELFARVLLGERQVRRHLAQLSRPPFEFDRAFPQRSVAVSKRHFSQLAVGDIDGRAYVTIERTVSPVSRHTHGHGPAVFAVRATKTMLHLERLALIEGRHINVSAPLDVVGMKELYPSMSWRLIRRPAGEIEPGLIHVSDLLVDVRHPDHHRSRIRDEAEAFLTLTRGLPGRK